MPPTILKRHLVQYNCKKDEYVRVFSDFKLCAYSCLYSKFVNGTVCT